MLGVAFIVHDLAHSRSAIPLTDTELKATTAYQDIVAQVVNGQLGRVASKAEIDSANGSASETTLGIYLRANHASLAAQLPTRSWKRL